MVVVEEETKWIHCSGKERLNGLVSLERTGCVVDGETNSDRFY